MKLVQHLLYKDGSLTKAVSFRYNKNEFLFAFTAIAAIVFVSSLVAILGYDIMYLDDNLRRTFALNDEFPWYISERNYFRPFFSYPLFKLLVIDPRLARLALVLFVMIPLSCIVFYLYRTIFSLPFSISLTASILPNILQKQEMIPGFIDGSYPVNGLIFSVLAFILGIKSLEQKGKRGILLLIFSILTYIFSIEMFDQAIFLIPPIVLVFLFWQDSTLNWRKILLIGAYVISGAVKAFILVSSPAFPKSGTPVMIPSAEIIIRIQNYFEYALPFTASFSVINQAVYIMLVIALIIAGYIFHLVNQKTVSPNISYLSGRRKISILYGFAFLWAICSIAPFSFSYYWSSRYSYISSFGLILMVLVSIYAIYYKAVLKFPRNYRLNVMVTFLAVIMASGYLRYESLSPWYKSQNHSHSVISRSLKDFVFPENSQIVIVGPSSIISGGYWHYSSGYLKFLTNRIDIQGMVGDEYQYYNAFDATEKTFNTRMTGLDLALPTFLFRMNTCQTQIEQHEYALQWDNKGDRNSKWTIHKFEKITGRSHILAQGEGRHDYAMHLTLMEKRGAARDAVIFGGASDTKVPCIEILEQQAEQGDIPSQIRLAILYGGSEGVEKNLSKRAYWLERAAEKNSPYAQYQLGMMYALGQGIAKNTKKAIDLYGKSAEQGERWGEYLLGTAFFAGIGITKDYEKAFDLFEKSANKGVPHAKLRLGNMYENGWGLKKDIRLAEKWYAEAADDGYEPARNALNRIKN